MDVKSKIKKNFHNIFSLVKNIWSIVNVPNVLTFVRIILIIPFSLEIMNENYSKSLKILMISGIVATTKMRMELIHAKNSESEFITIQQSGLRWSVSERRRERH